MSFEHPLNDYETEDWVQLGQRLALLTGMALIGIAVGVPWGAGYATTQLCGADVAALGCGDELSGINAVVLKPLLAGGALIVTAVLLERGVPDDR